MANGVTLTSISPYTTTNLLVTQTQYDFDGSPAYGLQSTTLAIRNLVWERSKENQISELIMGLLLIIGSPHFDRSLTIEIKPLI